MSKKAIAAPEGATPTAAGAADGLLDFIYPDPADAISFQPASIGQMKEDAIIFLDTNVLLLPYNTGKNSLIDIVRIYSDLIEQGRLVIPARVMQEFLKNSPDRLKEVFQKLSRQRNLNVPVESYPLLENVAEYTEFLNARKELVDQVKNFQQKLGKLVSLIQDWHHDDPVRQAYAKIFRAGEIVKLEPEATAAVTKESAFRYENKIPPGYKDGAKDDGGIGDLLIWKTILQVAKKRSKHAIFVCGEEKADWWHRSENQPLMVRHELIDEYRRESGGKTFRLLDMGDFLELFGAKKSVVQEVKEEQKTLAVSAQSAQRFGFEAERAVYNWLAKRGEGAVIVKQHGADFEVKSANGNTLVDVKLGRPLQVGKRVADCYQRAVKLRQMGEVFSNYMIVFVSENEQIASRVASEIPTWAPQVADWILMTCGFLDEAGNFIPVA
jgi:rRNA-processing protein FCF1